MMPPLRRFCIHGHDTAIVGRSKSGNCRECQRERNRANRRAGLSFGRGRRSRFLSRSPTRLDLPFEAEPFVIDSLDSISRQFGDFYAVEQDFGLLDYPHPNDTPLHGWPASGYGWPEDEFTPILLARVLMQAVADERAGYRRPRRQSDKRRAAAAAKVRDLKARGVNFRGVA